MRPSYQPITPSNAKRLLKINNRAMTAICQLIDRGVQVPTWGISDISQRIAECEAVLAAEQAKRDVMNRSAA